MNGERPSPEIKTDASPREESAIDFKKLFEEADAAIKTVLSNKEIEEKTEERERAIEELRTLDLDRQEQLRTTAPSNPFATLVPADYQRLRKEGVITDEEEKNYLQLDETIKKLHAVQNPNARVAIATGKAEKARGEIWENIAERIKVKGDEFSAYQEEGRARLETLYRQRVADLEKMIKDIEDNPSVRDHLHETAKKGMESFEAELAKEAKAALDTLSAIVQSLNTRHERAFVRLNEVLMLDDTKELLDNALRETGGREKISQLRERLIKSIVEEDGETQIKSPDEVSPSSIHYFQGLHTLQDEERAEQLLRLAKKDPRIQKLLESRSRVLKENHLLFSFLGPDRMKDKKSGQLVPSNLPFWKAFEQRQKNDKSGLTAKRKEQREKEKAESQKTINDFLKEHKGAFPVSVPVIENIGGKDRIVGMRAGAVLLERRTSHRKNESWVVTAMVGATNGLRVNDRSSLTMEQFPLWLRDAARPFFITRGDERVERLTYDEPTANA